MQDQTGENQRSVADQKPTAYSALLGRAEIKSLDKIAWHLWRARVELVRAFDNINADDDSPIRIDFHRLLDMEGHFVRAARAAEGRLDERPTQ